MQTGKRFWVGSPAYSTSSCFKIFNPRRKLNTDDTRYSLTPYCAVSVKVATGCPKPYGPSAVTCTVPALAGNVSTTAAFPVESVVTSRVESVPESAVNRMSAPAPEVPPDFPGAKVTERLRFVPGAPV